MNRRLQRLWASLLPSSGPRLPVIDFKRPHTCTQCITVLEWAAGLLERCDKQIFQPRREVWPSNPSGLAKVLLFLLRPFSSCFEYIWQFVILKKSDLDWGSNRDRLRALIGFNCTMSTWHVSSKSACASMDTDWTQTGHRLDTDWTQTGHRLDTDWTQTQYGYPWLRLLVLFRYHTEVFDYHWTSQIYR